MDASEMFDCFSSVSINGNPESLPEYGFYDYPLTRFDFQSRLEEGGECSLGLEEKGRLIAYVLAFPFCKTHNMNLRGDLVLRSIQCPHDVVYLDQLFMKPGLPAHDIGRLLDTWTKVVQDNKPQGVVSAIPQKPWRNAASTRLAIHRGFRRVGKVGNEKLELGIWSKPLWRAGEETYDVAVEF